MKKFIAIGLVVLNLTGCTTVSEAISDVSLAVTGVTNPVTKDTLSAFENSMIVAFAGLNAYKKSCIAGAVNANCRDTIAKMQVYTRQIPKALSDVRGFVKNNDTVNAQLAFNTAKQLFADFQAIATANSVKVQ